MVRDLQHALRMIVRTPTLSVVVVLSLGVTRLLQGLLHGVTPADPATFVVVAIVLIAVATIASAVPAWRASRVDPVLALKSE